MKAARNQWLLAVCGLATLAMLSSSAIAIEKTITVGDAIKKARATGKPILAMRGSET